MTKRWFRCTAGLATTVCCMLGCSSTPSSKSIGQPANLAHNNVARVPSTSVSAGQRNETNNITYATDPERFVKEPTYDPPFRLTHPNTADEHFDVAVNADNHKQFDEAIEHYRDAVQLRPNWAIARFRLAQDLDRQGNSDGAIAEWQYVLHLDPRFYAAYDRLARAYASRGDLRKAVEVHSRLLKLAPAQMPVLYQLGVWYEQLGERRIAIQKLENYRELAAKDDQERASPRYQAALHELQRLQQ